MKRPADVRMFEGVQSNPEPDYATEPYEDAESEETYDEPIPVIVVETLEPSDITDWGGEAFTIDGENPVHIAGRRRNRTRLTITNTGTDIVYLLKNAVGGSFTGAPLPVGAVLRMRTNSDVYATCASGDTALIGVIQEFVIDDDA